MITTSYIRSRIGLIATIVSFVTACSTPKYIEDAIANLAGVTSQETVRQMIIAEALAHYTFQPDSACQAAPAGVLTADRGPRPGTLTYATAVLTLGGGHTAGRIAGRITSSASYPALGIVAGVNYVWRDTVGGGGRRLLVVPAAPSSPLMWLAVGTTQYIPGPTTGIRCAFNISVGLCVGSCPEGHCAAEQSRRAYVPADSSTIDIHS